MSKVKKSLITIISLFAALFLILGLALGLPKTLASANTYSPSSIFSAGTGGEVGASDKFGEGDDAKAYVQFTFSDGGKVYYRRDLALKWYEGKDEAKYFSMQFSFGDINFEKFTIDFESAEENISKKDGKATNFIIFEKKEDDVYVSVNKPEKTDNESNEESGNETGTQVKEVLIDKTKDILISLDEGADCKAGEFDVYVENAENKELVGQFKNIGDYYLEYRSTSSSKANTPITFTATFPAETESGVRQKFFMKSLNNQPLSLTSSDRVDDTASAVLVLNEEVYSFKLGQKFSLSYKAIDVLDDSVTVTRQYYMLKTVEGTNYLPNETELKNKDGVETKYESYNYKSLTTSTYFLPSQDNKAETENPTEYVSIRFKLDDDTKDNETYVYLSWYAADSAIDEIGGIAYKEEGEGSDKTIVSDNDAKLDFIKVDRERKGPQFKYVEANENENKNKIADQDKYDEAYNAYQEAVNEVAKNTSAGSGAYMYLPSLRGLIESKYAGYRNLKFSIYYYKEGSSSASSQTSLSYNALKFEVDKEGWYKFRVLAQDSASNAMQYYLDGELVTVTGSNVWDIEGIPEFRFKIGYSGPTIEKTEEQSLGYRNDTYNFSSFDIVALAGYQTKYTLYRYNGANVPEGKAPSSYSSFVEGAKSYMEYFEEHDKGVENDKKILHEISVFDADVDEDDEAKWNRTDNDYYWDPDSSLSFVPQEAGFYILKLLVEDGKNLGESEVAYQVIEVRNPIDTIPGQSQWLEENVVSVVLFAIAGVLAIVVVVLFLVKPSDKKVEEVDLEKLKGKKKAKNEKK
ncbi:MAG: hypothetical protein K2L02_00885 [Clostridia bacterium]|nr:hypothetical protein [Clostridia bacterium]